MKLVVIEGIEPSSSAVDGGCFTIETITQLVEMVRIELTS